MRLKKGVQIILVGNEQECDNEREVTFEEGKALADKFNNEYIETSYKTWYNCTEAFVLITKKIIEYKAAERRKKNNKCFVLCQFEY